MKTIGRLNLLFCLLTVVTLSAEDFLVTPKKRRGQGLNAAREKTGKLQADFVAFVPNFLHEIANFQMFHIDESVVAAIDQEHQAMLNKAFESVNDTRTAFIAQLKKVVDLIEYLGQKYAVSSCKLPRSCAPLANRAPTNVSQIAWAVSSVPTLLHAIAHVQALNIECVTQFLQSDKTGLVGRANAQELADLHRVYQQCSKAGEQFVARLKVLNQLIQKFFN